MKKYLRPKHLPLIVPALGLLCLLLRLWTLGGGPDAEGLYAPQPVAWTLLWAVAACAAGLIFWLCLPLNHPGSYRQNFPASIPGAAGVAAGALAILISSVGMFTAANGTLGTITGILGILSAASLVTVAIARYQGKRPSFLPHAAVCLFFALRIFLCCKQWSNEPQLGTFLLPFLASVSVMLAAYQQAAFDVDLGKRRSSLFWSLMSVFFCIAALPACDEALFYILLAVWLITNLCSLRRLKPKAPETPAEPEQQADQ